MGVETHVLVGELVLAQRRSATKINGIMETTRKWNGNKLEPTCYVVVTAAQMESSISNSDNGHEEKVGEKR